MNLTGIHSSLFGEQQRLQEAQIAQEETYSRKHINKHIENFIKSDPGAYAKVTQGVELLQVWLKQPYHKEKQARLAQLDPLNLEELTLDIYVRIAYCQVPELFVSITAQLAAKLGFDNHRDSILTIAEVTSILAITDAFDIIKGSTFESLNIVNLLTMPTELIDRINRCMYLPPMLCPPQKVESNYESGYLTHNDSLILGSDNAHNEDICLDVLNTQNQIALSLSIEFLEQVPEAPPKAPEDQDQCNFWRTFIQQSIDLYMSIVAHGNRFYLTNKVDKGGRLYSQGYHINTQSYPYKKAMIEFADKQQVTGVPK